MVATWVLVALAAASLKTAYSALQKRLTVDYDGVEQSYVTALLGGAFLAPAGLYYVLAGDVTLTWAVTAAVLFSGLVNVVAIYTFLVALEMADLSVVAPLTQATPVIVALVEPLVLPAAVGPALALGAVAAVLGAYVLVADEGLSTPVGHLTDRAALLALLTASLYGVVSVTNRFVTTRVPPVLYAFAVYGLMALSFAAVRTARSESVKPAGLARPAVLSLGGLTALRTVVTYVAFSLAIASRVSVVLQASVVLNVVAGGYLFAEDDIARKLLGAALIVAGIVLTL